MAQQQAHHLQVTVLSSTVQRGPPFLQMSEVVGVDRTLPHCQLTAYLQPLS